MSQESISALLNLCQSVLGEKKTEQTGDAHESALAGLQSTLMGLIGGGSAKNSSEKEPQAEADDSSAEESSAGGVDPVAFLGGCKKAVEEHLGGLGVDVSAIMNKLETAVLKGAMSSGQKQVKDAIGGMIGNILKGGK